MAAILLDIKEGDEIIMPSYTFVSTANAFVLRGAKIVDIRPDTMNIDENAITKLLFLYIMQVYLVKWIKLWNLLISIIYLL